MLGKSLRPLISTRKLKEVTSLVTCAYDLILKIKKQQDEGKKLCWQLEVIKFVNEDAMLSTIQKNWLTRPSP